MVIGYSYRPTNPSPREIRIARHIIIEICISFLGGKPNFTTGDIPQKMETQLSVYAHQLAYNHYQSKMKEKVSAVEFTQS